MKLGPKLLALELLEAPCTATVCASGRPLRSLKNPSVRQDFEVSVVSRFGVWSLEFGVWSLGFGV